MRGKQNIKKWYEILLAVEDNWRPGAEDIVENNYSAAELCVPSIEFGSGATILDVAVYFQDPKLEGMRRPLRMFDILHMCINVQRSPSGVADFSAIDFLLVPRARLREFVCLTAAGRLPFADPNMPELCMVQLGNSFQKTFRKELRTA